MHLNNVETVSSIHNSKNAIVLILRA